MSAVAIAVVVYCAGILALALTLATYAEVRDYRRDRRQDAEDRAFDVLVDDALRCPRLHLVQRDEVAERRALRRDRTGSAA